MDTDRLPRDRTAFAGWSVTQRSNLSAHVGQYE